MRSPFMKLSVLLFAFGLLTAACGDTEPEEARTDDGTAGEEAASGALAGICPETIVIQKDWHPEAEHGALYEMLSKDDYEIDAAAGLFFDLA